jgi:hypothetical protein
VTEKEVLELARVPGEWLFDRRERLETHDREGIASLWLPLSEIESILRGFDLLDAAGALTVEGRVLQDDLIGLISGGNAPVIETPWTPSEPLAAAASALASWVDPKSLQIPRSRGPGLDPRTPSVPEKCSAASEKESG